MYQGQQVWRASLVDHGGHSAYDIVNVIPRAVDVGLEEGISDESGQVIPVLGPDVNQDVVHLELVGELLGPIIQGGPHDKVIILAESEYQRDRSLVLRVPQYLRCDLHEGG